MVVIVVLGAILSLPLMNPDQRDRFLSIVSSDTRNASTAGARISSIGRQFEVALQRPIVGHGLGSSREANFNFAGGAQRAHVLYGEVATESMPIVVLFYRHIPPFHHHL